AGACQHSMDQTLLFAATPGMDQRNRARGGLAVDLGLLSGIRLSRLAAIRVGAALGSVPGNSLEQPVLHFWPATRLSSLDWAESSTAFAHFRGHFRDRALFWHPFPRVQEPLDDWDIARPG